MDILWFIVGWVLGLVVFSFTAIQCLIILAFGMPTTKRLIKLGVLKSNNGIMKKELASLLILTTIFLLIILAIYFWLPLSLLIGYLVGCLIVFFMGLGKIGINENNISDYISSNEKQFTDSAQVVRYTILQWKSPNKG